MSDNVKSPIHYCKGGLECIEAIKAAVSTIADPFEAYCTGNIIKYIWRWNDKNGIEDLHKAIQYIDFIEAYRNADKTVSVVTNVNDDDMGEEDVGESEPVKGKYEGLSDVELKSLVCSNTGCATCPIPNKCRINNNSLYCHEFINAYPTQFRSLAIAYLEGLEGKA